MTFRTWHLAVVAAAVLTGCAELATDESAATNELSVLNWSNDIVFHTGVSGSSEPAIAGTGGAILVVWPNGGSSDHTYLFWMFRGTNGLWSPPTEMSPRASSTARPTLVAFNGFYYVFYASGSISTMRASTRRPGGGPARRCCRSAASAPWRRSRTTAASRSSGSIRPATS